MTEKEFFENLEDNIKNYGNYLCGEINCSIDPPITKCPLKNKCPYFKIKDCAISTIDNFIKKQYKIYKAKILAEKLK